MVNHDEIMVIIVDYNGLTMVNNDENHGYLVGGWYAYPSEKSWSSSVGVMTFPI